MTYLLTSEAHGCRPQPRARNWFTRGSITVIARGLMPHAGCGAYSPAKAALVMLWRQLAQEWPATRIRIDAPAPCLNPTPRTEAFY